MAQRRRCVVFGIFDGVHEGHRDLFRQALRLASLAQGKPAELIVIVGRDSIAEQLKGKWPKYSEAERLEMLKQENLVDQVVLGDKELSSYKVLGKLNPDVICVGYDQDELEKDLRQWVALRQAQGKNIQIHRAKPYQDGTLHNSAFS